MSDLKNLAIWIGENNLSRNSFGLWQTNVMDLNKMTDDELVDIYSTNPSFFKDHKNKLRKMIADSFIKQYPQYSR